MDPTGHIPEVTLFCYLLDVMPLKTDERQHLEVCSHCRSVLEEFEPYVKGRMSHAA